MIDRPINYKPICRIPDNNQGVFALVSCHDPALVETNASAGNIICLKSEKPNIHKRNGVKGKSWFQSAGPIIIAESCFSNGSTNKRMDQWKNRMDEHTDYIKHECVVNII